MTLDLNVNVRPLAFCVSLALAYYGLRTLKRRITHKHPPGPKGLPFLGPLFELSSTPWKEFERWKARYGMLNTSHIQKYSVPKFHRPTGPLVYLSVAGQKMLVLNTHKVAADLLDRRGTIYSDRPQFISELCGSKASKMSFLTLYSSLERDIHTWIIDDVGEVRRDVSARSSSFRLGTRL